jgi:predicted ATPase
MEFLTEVSMANIGPIRSSNIRLRPLTVFVGPNNTGKSMALTVQYSALMFGSMPVSYEHIWAIRRSVAALEQETQDHIVRLVRGAEEPPALPCVPEAARDLLRKCLHDSIQIYAEAFVEELSRSTGTPLVSLRRSAPEEARSSISIASETPQWNVDVQITRSGPEFITHPPSLEDVWALLLRDQRWWRQLRSRPDSSEVLTDIAVNAVRAAFFKFPMGIHYMPAARSGLMQSHKVIARSLVRQAAYGGIRDTQMSGQMPAVTGTVADFLTAMIDIAQDESGDFPEHAQQLEREILNGSIELELDTTGKYPEPVYKSSAGTFKLRSTSSMVSELAPVVLFLRHVLRKGDLLMIEEPEAHLHPQAQVAFAKALVRLVNAELQIAITTHSEFFLQQLNNAVVASSVREDATDEIGLDRNTRLKPESVAAYLFKPDNERGTEVAELPVDPHAGIPEDSFSEVTEYLYAQTVALDNRVGDGAQE